MAKIETTGFRGWWPMREFCGKDNLGRRLVKEGFRNVVTGEFHCDPAKGWDGEPPNPTGEILVSSNSDSYVSNFEGINWNEPQTQETEKPLHDSVAVFARNCYRENFDKIAWQ